MGEKGKRQKKMPHVMLASFNIELTVNWVKLAGMLHVSGRFAERSPAFE